MERGRGRPTIENVISRTVTVSMDPEDFKDVEGSCHPREKRTYWRGYLLKLGLEQHRKLKKNGQDADNDR